ncbi:hypothetical protein Golob_020761, partial [Gossypium lobatum]|nr:hypothetical protein [Gossypium lobatum]
AITVPPVGLPSNPFRSTPPPFLPLFGAGGSQQQHQCHRFCLRQRFMPSHAFLFFTAVLIDPAGHHRRVCRFQTTNEVHYLVSAVVPAWCILVVPLLHRGTSLLLSTSPPSFDYGSSMTTVFNVLHLSDALLSFSRFSRELSPRKQLKEEAELLVEQLMISVQYA